MRIPHISLVFVPVTGIGDLDGLEQASMDEDSCAIGAAGRYGLPGVQVPVNELEQRGIPDLVAQPAAMVIGLSTHEQALLVPRARGMWELLLRSRNGPPERYSFRDRPEPRPVVPAPQRRQYAWQ